MLINIKDVMQMVGIKQSTIYKYMKTKGFPKPIKLSQKCSRWKKEEVEKWIQKISS